MNRNLRLFSLSIAFVALLMVGYAKAQPKAPTKAASPKAASSKTTTSKRGSIVVVDVKKLFDSLKEKVDLEAKMKTGQVKLTAELNKKKAAIDKLKNALPGLRRGSPDYNAKRDELELKTIELQAWATLQERKVARTNVVQTGSLYHKMSASIAEISKSNGYDLVLYKERPLSLVGIKSTQISAVLQSRKVIYVSERLDITDLVVLKMNNDYVNGQK